MITRRARVGLALSVIWLIACMIALSGKCQATPKRVLEDPLLNPGGGAERNRE